MNVKFFNVRHSLGGNEYASVDDPALMKMAAQRNQSKVL
jgi:hypothetical protein